MRAGAGIRKGGGTSAEAAEVQKATVEFQNLFNTIKETRKALATMTEGTEEYDKAQQTLTENQTKASEALAKIQRISGDVERRRITGDGGPGVGQRAGGMIAGAAGFAGDAFDKLGGMATQRYVMEEQRKQSQLQLQNMGMSDIRNSADDATAFLATGGGAKFGMEMPYNKNGSVTEPIKKLGQDYADTREAGVQYGVGARAVERLAKAGVNTMGDTAATNVMAPGTGVGSAIKNFGGAGLETGKDFFLTPEMAGRFGGADMARGARNFMSSSIEGVGTLASGVGADMVAKGGGDANMMISGGRKVTSGVDKLATTGLKIAERAYETNNEQNQLISTEQQQAQAARVRERLSMAYAPAMQSYMDIQGSQRGIGRSRVMSPAERQAEERRNNKFATDEDLGERGFGPEDILANTSQAARSMGRFGGNGVGQRVAKSAMLGESMGLGDSSQSIGAMSKMLQGGIKDPEAMFTKAMKEGLQKGLQDSREFQGLLAAASETSSNTADFEGSLNSVLRMAGSGRATDVMTAQAGAKSLKDMTSGQTGGWEDMVKFDVVNKATKGITSSAAGKDLGREDITSFQNLTGYDSTELRNKDLVKNSITPKALKAVEAQEGGIDKFIEDLVRSSEARLSAANATNSTQSEDVAAVGNMIANKDVEGLKKMFTGPDGKVDKERLQKVYSQYLSGNKQKLGVNAAQGIAQGMLNDIKSVAGIDTGGIGMTSTVEGKDFDTVKGQSGAANTFNEKNRRGKAQTKQSDISLIDSQSFDAEGNNVLASSYDDMKGRYDTAQKASIDSNKNARTVSPSAPVERLDQAVMEIVKGLGEMKDSFKNFSAKEFAITATKDVVISGAQAIKGVILGDGLSAAATKAGQSIADAVNNAIGTSTSKPGAGTPATKQGSGKSNPTPLGQ